MTALRLPTTPARRHRLLVPTVVVALASAAVLTAATPTTARAGSTLGPATSYPVGNAPHAVAVGDVNDDTIADLVVANWSSGSVSVLLGEDAGGFGAATSYPTVSGGGRLPNSVAIADVNADTFVDIVVGVGGAGLADDVQVLLGTGGGAFGAASLHDAGTDPWAVVVGNFIGDGNVDIATANRNTDNVSLLAGDGQGGFAAPVNVAVGSFPTAIATGDLNGDFRADLVTTNANSDDISVLLSNGAGSFHAAASVDVGPYPGAVAIGIVDGDSSEDVVVADNVGGDVTVLLNDGTGDLTARPSVATGDGAGAVAIGDVAGSGANDVVVGNYFDDTVSVLTGDYTGALGAKTDHPSAQPYAVAVGLLDDDLARDLVYVNEGSDDVTVRLGSNPADLGKVTVKGPSSIRKGRATAYDVKMTNSGGDDATGLVLSVSGKGVSASTKVGKLPGGWSRTVTVKLSPRTKGSIKVTFKITSSNAGTAKVVKTIKVT